MPVRGLAFLHGLRGRGAVAVGAVAYVWWRHRRDQEFARLLDPEPRHPDPVPADPPDQPLAPEPPSDTTAGDPIDAVATEGPATEESAPDAAPADQPSVGEPEPVPALASDAQPATESAVPRAAVNVVAEGARTSSRRGRDSRPFPVGRQVRGPSVTRIPSFRTKLPSGGPTAVASANKQFARGR